MPPANRFRRYATPGVSLLARNKRQKRHSIEVSTLHFAVPHLAQKIREHSVANLKVGRSYLESADDGLPYRCRDSRLKGESFLKPWCLMLVASAFFYGPRLNLPANLIAHLLGMRAYYSIMSICFLSRRSMVNRDSSYSF